MISADIILKRDRVGRVKVTRDRRRAILEEFNRSGMSGAGFARHYGIKYATFAGWILKRRKSLSAPASSAPVEGMRFVEAVVDRVNPVRTGALNGLRVELPGGAHLELNDERQASLVAHLLRTLADSERSC